MLTPACFPSLERHDAASRTDDRLQLSDEQWFLIEDLFDWHPPTTLGGRPIVPPRAVLEALLWMLRNGGPWKDLPEHFASESTVAEIVFPLLRERPYYRMQRLRPLREKPLQEFKTCVVYF